MNITVFKTLAIGRKRVPGTEERFENLDLYLDAFLRYGKYQYQVTRNGNLLCDTPSYDEAYKIFHKSQNRTKRTKCEVQA
jgi:hypothetical protein